MATAMKFQTLVLGALLTTAAYCQEEQSQPDNMASTSESASVPNMIAKVKSGDFALVHVEMIAEAGAVEAIPILKEQFSRSHDLLRKAKIADALVRLGVDDNTYWNFLVQGVERGLETDAPYVTRSDSQPGLSDGFTDWAKAHNLTTDSALETLYKSAIAMSFLAETGDPRGIPLLRRGLLSPYFLTQAFAAEGLAKIQDKESIPLIIEACKSAPAAAASGIAKSLVYFDDKEAQRAVDRYIPNDTAKLYRESRASEKKASGQKTPQQ